MFYVTANIEKRFRYLSTLKICLLIDISFIPADTFNFLAGLCLVLIVFCVFGTNLYQ